VALEDAFHVGDTAPSGIWIEAPDQHRQPCADGRHERNHGETKEPTGWQNGDEVASTYFRELDSNSKCDGQCPGGNSDEGRARKESSSDRLRLEVLANLSSGAGFAQRWMMA
jgi:hypothetical protein